MDEEVPEWAKKAAEYLGFAVAMAFIIGTCVVAWILVARWLQT
jgi:hypothetical protein